MTPASRNPEEGPLGEPMAAVGGFRFIPVQGAPSDTKQLATRRQARSHAVKHALENKRKLQQEAGNNFRATTPKDLVHRKKSKCQKPHAKGDERPPLSSSLSVGVLDPFETLAVNSSRLQALLSTRKPGHGSPNFEKKWLLTVYVRAEEARCASEPVFTIAGAWAFQNFRCVFRTGFVDPALLNAVMLSFAVAAAKGKLDGECLGYRGQAISHIRERVSSQNEATTESTIGAILLLAGVEARFGKTSQVQLHLGAVRQLLDLCQKEGIQLTDGIKRAVFWQDLNGSILSGSSRIVDHTTFTELQWTRDALPTDFFAVPTGFQIRPHLLTDELLEIFKDIRALQWIRDRPIYSRTNPADMARINDQTASIQSRLADLKDLSPTMECFRLAGYICSVMLCCSVWCAAVFPSEVSSQLLRVLQQTHDDKLWDDDPDLLLWILYMGGTYAHRGAVRYGYVALLRFNNVTRFKDLYRSWLEALEVLKQFVWSDAAFLAHVRAFWDEVHNPNGLAEEPPCRY
ncbi:hypothetical protein PG993_014004 [Apiospora rasikravindrae]|uniref:Uncharacterized protein n=1 Tax=Apiospora rasikravindrae TaxID=990691 RepID=A0ABR1RRY7_9PEZI